MLSILFLASCSQEEMFYSCNPIVNEWAEENLDEISKMERKNWLTTKDVQYRMAIYVAFSPEQKFSFWEGKLNEVLKLNWSQNEHEHIVSLLEYVKANKEIFNPEGFDEDSFDKFIYLWIEKSKEEFAWNSSIIYAIIASGEKMIDTKGTLEVYEDGNIVQRIKTRTESHTPDCDCNINDDWCMNRVSNPPSPGYPTMTADCKNATCKVVSGCGTFFRKKCDGKCVFDYI